MRAVRVQHFGGPEVLQLHHTDESKDHADQKTDKADNGQSFRSCLLNRQPHIGAPESGITPQKSLGGEHELAEEVHQVFARVNDIDCGFAY